MAHRCSWNYTAIGFLRILTFMAFNIEIVSVGGDFDRTIEEVSIALNGVQNEFLFQLAPKRLRTFLTGFVRPNYLTTNVFDALKNYRREAKGHRPYVIGIIDRPLASKELGNLFGSHNARGGMAEAVVTLHSHRFFTESAQLYLCYYFIRYALSFVCHRLKNHEETRGCFFDKKRVKRDLKLSMDSGGICPECRAELWKDFNQEITIAVESMVRLMKALRANSEDSLPAAALRGRVDVGIITIREDEFEAVLDRFSSRRHLIGTASNYELTRVAAHKEQELLVAVARSPEQGQSAAQALTSTMIADLAPKWIFVVGIAGGFPGAESTLGDVLLSQRMHDFAVSAAIEGKEPEFQDMGGPMVRDVEKLVAELKAHRHRLSDWNRIENIGISKPKVKVPKDIKSEELYGKAPWKKKVLEALKAGFPRKGLPRLPDFFAAVIIASNTLLKDTSLATQWRRGARHASGVEMELGGVCRAARAAGDGRTRVLAIRGLSDIVGYKRSPDWTAFACKSAAAFTDALLRSGLIRAHSGE